MVWWTILWQGLSVQANTLSKDTTLYPKICPAIGLTKLHLYSGQFFCTPNKIRIIFSILWSKDINLIISHYFKICALHAGLGNIYISGQKCKNKYINEYNSFWLFLCNCTPFYVSYTPELVKAIFLSIPTLGIQIWRGKNV